MNIKRIFRNWADIVELPANATVFSEHDPADAMYVVLEGEVELSLRGEPVGTEGEGGVIGEVAMIDSGEYGASATTLADTRLARLDHDRLRSVIEKNTDFSLHVMGIMARRLRALDRLIGGAPRP